MSNAKLIADLNELASSLRYEHDEGRAAYVQRASDALAAVERNIIADYAALIADAEKWLAKPWTGRDMLEAKAFVTRLTNALRKCAPPGGREMMTNEELGRRINKHPIWTTRDCSEDEATGIAAREVMRAELPPICGMSEEEIAAKMRDAPGAYATEMWWQKCARVACSLAQSAPKVDPDAEAKRLAFVWETGTAQVWYPKDMKENWDRYPKPTRERWRAVVTAKEAKHESHG